MRVPVVIYADQALMQEMDDKVLEQARNVATLPGIVRPSCVMPDGHWGYGFPIGGVAAFDAQAGGVVSAGGVGFDISCGVTKRPSGISTEPLLECAFVPLVGEKGWTVRDSTGPEETEPT